ncbi:MAG: hypothetical protein KDC82_02960 [Bacteroidetes bacterium]|nr:hypothetical protein [Bacteroidota bacterium]
MAKLPKYMGSMLHVYRKYVTRAAERNIEFNIDITIFKITCEKDCYYCGASPTSSKDHDRYNGAWKYNGLDRTDNSKGYIESNIQPCCTLCNRLKSNMKETDFLNHIAKIMEKRKTHG